MTVRCGNHTTETRHASPADVRECYADRYAREYEEEYEASLVYCSLCDGLGHGQPGYGPCPLEERGADEAYAERQWENARGVLQWEDARDLAEGRV